MGLFVLAFVLMMLSGLSTSRQAASTSPPIAHIFPAIFAAGLIGTAIFKVRHGQRVSLSREGLAVDGALGRRLLSWPKIRHARLGSATAVMGQATMSVLDLFDTNGRRVARLGGTIMQFGRLTNLIQSAVRVHHPHPPDERWLANALRSAERLQRGLLYLLLIPVGLAFLAGGCWGSYEGIKNRRLVQEGVVTHAQVERHFMRSVTPYVAYAFSDQAGQTHRRESMVKEAEWEQWQGASTVEVQYLQSDPEWNRLVVGSAESEMGTLFVFAMFGMAAFMLGSVAFMASGWDLKSEQGVTRLTRFGLAVCQWGKRSERSASLDEAFLADVTTAFDAQKLPAALSADDRLPPGLLLIGVAMATIGASLLAAGAAGIALLSSEEAAGQSAAGGGEVIVQVASAMIGVIVIASGIAIARRWRSAWHQSLIALPMAALFVLVRLALRINVMATLPDLPGKEGFAIRAGLIGGVLLDVIVLASVAVLLVLLARPIVRSRWIAPAA